MITVRTLTAADLPFAMRLKEQAGWNQTESDWRRILSLQPRGCFAAELDGRPVGTVCVSVFGPIGWIAMMLVEQSVRGRGIGTRLMQQALAYLETTAVRTVRLDATPLGRPLYDKLGFVAEYELARWEGVAAGGATAAEVVPAGAEWLAAIGELDRQATGTDRRALLQRLNEEQPDALHVCLSGGQVATGEATSVGCRTATPGRHAGQEFAKPAVIRSPILAGYFSLRWGSRAVQIGPLVARDAAIGRVLADAALHRCAGRLVFLDVPCANRPAAQWAEQRGLRIQRPLLRMRRGEPVADRPDGLWGSFGPEKG
jgi:GNAT superfamily N-acetyltransferase